VFSDNPVNKLVNDPIPEPFLVILFDIVGFEVVLLKQTPREVTVDPPSLDMVPPPDAVFCAIADIDVVDDTIGRVAAVVVKAIYDP
jgi:hypothetical protein